MLIWEAVKRKEVRTQTNIESGAGGPFTEAI
jgi:hypothetical protein